MLNESAKRTSQRRSKIQEDKKISEQKEEQTKEEKKSSTNTKISDFFPNKQNKEESENGEDKLLNKKRNKEGPVEESINLEEVEDAENNSASKKPKKKVNKDICHICRVGEDLLNCANCPKSFHKSCLKMKANEKTEGTWNCPSCVPIIEKRKQKEVNTMSLDERRIAKREKRRLWRLRQKEMKKNGTLTKIKPYRRLNGKKLKSKLGGVKKNLNSSLTNANTNPIDMIISGKLKEQSYPLIDVVTPEVQYKILEESAKMDEYLISKFVNKSSPIIQKKLMESFLSKYKNEVIDITQDFELPSKEEINKVYSSIVRNDVMDFIEMGKLLETNPYMYSLINNLYNESLKLKKAQAVARKEAFQRDKDKKNAKFPIDDSELYKNYDLYGLSKDFLYKPEGRKLLIPNSQVSRVLKLWDFIHSFKSKLSISEFSPEQLYFSLNYYDEEEIPLISEIHSNLVFVIGEQISMVEHADIMKIDDYGLNLFKILIDNPSAPRRYFYKRCWVEVIKIVMQSKMFSLMMNEELSDLANRLKYVNTKNYNLLSFDEKIILLEFLLNTVMSSPIISSAIKEDMERRSELNREKLGLQNELKTIESRKREIERQEKFTQPQVKVDALNKRLATLVEDNPALSRMEMNKLRKDLEYQRDQFKSVIKEAGEIDINRNKILTRIEKLSDEIYETPSTNKKLIGKDAFKNEYYFFPQLNNRLYVKKFPTGTRKSHEWREYINEEEIRELLTKLSEKGINEKNLITKINKILYKRFKQRKSATSTHNIIDITIIDENKMVVDDVSQPEDKDKELIDNIIKSAKEWRNSFSEKLNKKSENLNPFDEISEMMISLESKITDYFHQDDKEWEAFNIRQDFKAWLSMTKDITELSKVLLLFDNKFKTPYRIHDTKNKIVEDEDEYCNQHTIFTEDHKLEPFKINAKRTLAPKAKLWSKDLEVLDELFIEYVKSINSLPSLFFGYFVFESVLCDLFKRRETYKKKNKEDKKHNFDDDVDTSNAPKETSSLKLSELDDYVNNEALFKNDIFAEAAAIVEKPRSRMAKTKANNLSASAMVIENNSGSRTRRVTKNSGNFATPAATKKKMIVNKIFIFRIGMMSAQFVMKEVTLFAVKSALMYVT